MFNDYSLSKILKAPRNSLSKILKALRKAGPPSVMVYTVSVFFYGVVTCMSARLVCT